MTRRRLFRIAIALFLLINAVAFQHAYKFTHFDDAIFERQDPAQLGVVAKVGLLFTGVSIPKPRNIKLPARDYETIEIQSTKLLECWQIKTPGAKGTVIMFLGYAGEKSSLLERADLFMDLGYNVLLVDFMGSGGSEGYSTSIGYAEAEQVKDCFTHVSNTGQTNIVLF